MATPATRTPVRIARGSYSNLNSSISDLGDGEIVYAEDQDKLYVKEGSSLVVLTQPAASPTFTGTVTIPTPTAGDNSTVAASTAFVATSFAPKASPTFSGTPAAPTAADGTNNTQIATTAFVHSGYATKASPTYSGTPAAPTASANTNTTQIATTAFVMTEVGDYAPLSGATFTGTVNGTSLVLSADLTVNGTTTTINTTNLDVEDKNITLGKVSSPSDTTADGGGITLKGASDKTFNWVDATDAWKSSEHLHLGDNKKLLVGNASDFTIGHNGTNTTLINNTGDLRIRSDSNIKLQNNDGTEAYFTGIANGAVELYHNNSKKFETTAAGVTVTGTVTDTKGDVRRIPQNTQSSTYTLVSSDGGKHILASGNVTIPNSIFAAGEAVTIVNNTAGDLTLTASIGTLYNTADGSTGNRTLAQRGMATIWFSSSSGSYISGAGLS